jgi:5-formyltetrahydrofolate cyclo-ligase
MENKKEIRAYIRALKKQYSNEELIELSRPVTDKLLKHKKVKEAQTILMYYSLADEVYTHDTITKLVNMNKTVLLPRVIDDENMIICHYKSDKDLSEGAFHIMEPIGEEFTDYNKIELCIVPGMSFDSNNNRLGRGKGYYDRFLAKVPNSYKIGVCFDFQKLKEIPSGKYDINVDEVI